MKKLLAVLTLIALAGCSGGPIPKHDRAGTEGDDTGIAWCRKLAASAADPFSGNKPAPTEDDLDKAENAWGGSNFPELRRDGLAHLEVLRRFYAGDDNISPADVVLRRDVLDDTCKAYGVPIIYAPSSNPITSRSVR